MKAGIAGAGILGRLMALELVKTGWSVTVFDQHPQINMDNCSMAAAGLLTPMTELDKCPEIIFALGRAALSQHWPEIVNTIDATESLQRRGSLVISHPNDAVEVQRFTDIINSKLNQASYRVLDQANILDLEPELTKWTSAFYFQDEGCLDSHVVLEKLIAYLAERQVRVCLGEPVLSVAPSKIVTQRDTYDFDWVFDCRGLGAKDTYPSDLKKLGRRRSHETPQHNGFYVRMASGSENTPRTSKAMGMFSDLRGVRGEAILLHAPDVTITRPVRLLNPKYSLYIVPKKNKHYVLGASEIESEDQSPISVRTALELLTSAYYVHPGFLEARIIKTISQLRPTLNDHLPKIKYTQGLIAINGLYRHGFLIAPSLVKDVLHYVLQGIFYVNYADLWEKIDANHFIQ